MKIVIFFGLEHYLGYESEKLILTLMFRNRFISSGVLSKLEH